ncbi:hypothetical protein F5B19DRAFT_183311 [Rostrohypoxylon terebratum]|nr:hypothetical protein F5B19DRAFT_183311 [Rostrohypoxylon terebratum]
MAITTRRDPAIVCAERIAALHFLHHIPVNPSSNPVTTAQNRSAGYTLPFEKERELASTLAFLALFKDDNNHIPAVCIEEDPGAAHINVLLAVNKLKYDDGQQMLEDLKKSFDGIFSLLDQDYAGESRPADALNTSANSPRAVNSSRIEHDLFQYITSMCRERILHRLRLKGRLSQKTSIKKALQTAFDYYLRYAGLLDSLFIQRAMEVIRLTDIWINCSTNGESTNGELENLVEGIHHLWQVDHLAALIKEIPENTMQSNLRDSLLNMISKVSRYREAARFLYRLGKKTPLARKMRTVIIQWTRPDFTRSAAGKNVPGSDITIPLDQGLGDPKRNLQDICDLLNSEGGSLDSKLTREEASEQLTAQTRKTLREAKIHAEIQLLYYCDSNIHPDRLPRVVCSSKDACWLCNEFILLYGKIHTPKSHGKIYPGWRVPVVKGNEWAKKYNDRLEGTLMRSLKALFTSKKRTEYPCPNESTLLALYLSDSTLSNVELPLRDGNGQIVQEASGDHTAQGEESPTHELLLSNDEENTLHVGEVEKPEDIEVPKETAEIEEAEKVQEAENEEKPWDSGEESDMDIYSSEVEDAWIASLGARAWGSQEPWDSAEARETEEVGEVQDANDVEDAAPTTPDEHENDDSYDANKYTERRSSGCSSSSSEGSLTLQLGEVRSMKIWMGKSTPLYNAGPLLNIQVEYATSKGLETPNTPHNLHKKLSYSLQRLTPEEARKIRSGGGVPISGADLPAGHWVEGNTDEDGSVYIANGGEVMKLSLRPILG